MQVRDYTFLGTTRSLCPECRRLVEAQIIVRHGRGYLRKQCPEHGTLEHFVCSDAAPSDRPATRRDRLEIYLQFDGLENASYVRLRGEELLAAKLAALETLQEHDLRCTLVCTVDHNTNLHEVGAVVKFGLERQIVRGVSFQLA